ncbi:hypothetical protein H9Q08_14370 [Chryseobacterium sp. PS-8]|uniref:Uncharacterized protein n=1 Tax=Chryseobacterium indicum TaxID=2766954 RepID=A0ABS9C9W8_9FLAO|nr:hypothetical protein [Chryseobacterium sp. PS-8]MCF2220469.1 hypothetical protein [Chryseobacterium sp. PS-8]
MKITRLFLFLSLLFFSFGKAQLSAFINGKEVKSGATISKNDLETLEVSFKKPKNVTIYSGYSKLYVEFSDNTKTYINHWGIQKEGYTAMEDFIKNTPATKKFSVWGGNDFETRGNNLEWILNGANGIEKQKSIRVEIGFWVREETGYKEYGPTVQLLEPIFFNVPIWEPKNLYLPYLDVTIDKTNIKEDINTSQTGSTDRSDTEVGYQINKNQETYKIYAFEKSAHPGLTVDELANDFIHRVTYHSNNDKVKKIHEYDFQKYNLPWYNICVLFRDEQIQYVDYFINKDVKSKDLMSLYEKVQFGNMKGYLFKSGLYNIGRQDGKVHKDVGQFEIYILNHPTNADLVLMICNEIGRGTETAQAIDNYMQTFIKSIKQ